MFSKEAKQGKYRKKRRKDSDKLIKENLENKEKPRINGYDSPESKIAIIHDQDFG